MDTPDGKTATQDPRHLPDLPSRHPRRAVHHGCADINHWRARCREIWHAGFGRGRRKRTHQNRGTSPAPYFTPRAPGGATPPGDSPRMGKGDVRTHPAAMAVVKAGDLRGQNISIRGVRRKGWWLRHSNCRKHMELSGTLRPVRRSQRPDLGLRVLGCWCTATAAPCLGAIRPFRQ
jgi:hypothetical protein